MTLAELQRAVELLPSGSSVTLARDELLAAFKGTQGDVVCPAPPEAPDRLLAAKEVAQRMGVSTKYVYEHAGEFPFTCRVSPRALRFSEKGLERWLARRR